MSSSLKKEHVKDTESSKQQCCRMSANQRSGWLLGCGAVLVVVGAVVAVVWPAMFLGIFREVMVLTPDSVSFEVWSRPVAPMVSEFYFFNITNVDEILAGLDVPLKVAQMGPYVYEEDSYRTNITWNDNSTVTFYNNRTWKFMPELSVGTEADMVTTINPIIATISYALRDQSALIKIPMDLLLRSYHDTMFQTANVSDWLWNGVEDAFLQGVGDIPEEQIPIDIEIPPFDKFGWFYGRNGSTEFDGEFVMNTGASDFSKIGTIELWNGSNRTTFRGECGEVRGGRGEFWALEKGQKEIVMFVSDICTQMALAENGGRVVAGIEGIEFAANTSLFDNGYNYPKHACHCDEVRDDNCVRPGNLNVSSCRYGSPSFVSLPHFYMADPYYPDKIHGLDPNDSHNFRMTLESYTGIPMAVSAQLQINMLVRHVQFMSLNNQLPDADVMVPMFWFRQEMALSDEDAQQIRLVLNIRDGPVYGFYALIAFGACLILAGSVVLVRKLRRPSSDSTHNIIK